MTSRIVTLPYGLAIEKGVDDNNSQHKHGRRGQRQANIQSKAETKTQDNEKENTSGNYASDDQSESVMHQKTCRRSREEVGGFEVCELEDFGFEQRRSKRQKKGEVNSST